MFDDKLLKLKNQSIIHYESGTSIQLFYSGSLNEKLKDIPSLVSIDCPKTPEDRLNGVL